MINLSDLSSYKLSGLNIAFKIVLKLRMGWMWLWFKPCTTKK